MTSKEIRQKYLDFYKAQGHTIIPSASIMPENDSSTLFTSSGMQPLVPYLLGEKHPEGTRLCNSQKSFRAEDIEEVGDNRHTTFFEMLGNWSLGDYFKKEQLPWIFTFLTRELGIDPTRLYVTVFRGKEEIGISRDDESVGLWKNIYASAGIEASDLDYPSIEAAEEIGMQDARIFSYIDKKNWWSRSGVPANMPVGEPGGPDSEIFIDLGADLKRHENSPWADKKCHVNCDCGRFIELGNSVFMEFIRTEEGFEKLKQQNVDFGGGLERIVMAIQGKDNIFETDLFINILDKISELSGGKQYRDNMRDFEVIADHMRATTFIMGDDKGVTPSNVGAGYIVRRLIRRAVRYGRNLGITGEGWTKSIASIIIDDYGDVYPELARNREFVIRNLDEEELKFQKTIEQGLQKSAIIIKTKKPIDNELYNQIMQVGNKGEVLKQIFNDINTLGFRANGLEIDNQSVINATISGEEGFYLYQTYGFPVEMIIEIAQEKKLFVDVEGFRKESDKHQELSRTASAGMFKGGLADASAETTRLHTTAHLLLAALRKVLGDHVTQKGSNITAERLRFDFSHPEKMTDEQKNEVEKIVNNAIQAKLPVTCREITLAEAKAENAMGVFESKYGEKVKVYTIGSEDEKISNEICGGPHIENTSELGVFKIKKEESSSAGVRRIKAILE